jgi:hypothetical protein
VLDYRGFDLLPMLGAEPDLLDALGSIQEVDAQLDDILAQHLAAIDAAGRRRVPVVQLAQPEPPLATPRLYAHGGGRRRVAAALRALPKIPDHGEEATPEGGRRPGATLQRPERNPPAKGGFLQASSGQSTLT